MELPQPFIRLPFDFDAQRLAAEAVALEDTDWLPHPSGFKGNSASPLISRDGEDNDEFAGRMLPTPRLGRCPYHRQVMAGFGEVLTRSRLMKLDAGCEVVSHVDFNYHWYSRVRMHIPVVTNPDVIFYCDDTQIHMGPGECWIFDNWRRHRVFNGGQEDRIHFVIDLAGSSRFWNMVREMQALDADGIAERIRFVPFVPEAPAEIIAENYNLPPVMAPGELESLVGALIRDFENHPDNDPALVEHYRRLLTDFASDWRTTWLRYGMQPEGVPHYRGLIDNAAAGLHPERKALLISSNGIGVNAVVMQRILRPALAPNMLGHFLNSDQG